MVRKKKKSAFFGGEVGQGLRGLSLALGNAESKTAHHSVFEPEQWGEKFQVATFILLEQLLLKHQ